MVEGNVLFNDALNTFYLRLYGVRHIMVKNHSDSERENPLPPHGGPIELFLVPASASVTKAVVCVILVCGMMHIK